MEGNSLKEYIAKVFELEMAVYTQERIIDNFKKQREKYFPKEPQLQLPEPPVYQECMNKVDYFGLNEKINPYEFFAVGVSLLVGSLMSLFVGLGNGWNVFSVLGVVGLLGALFYLYRYYRKLQKKGKQYAEYCDEIKKQNTESSKKYKEKCNELRNNHLKSKELYKTDCDYYASDTKSMLNKHTKIQRTLEETLLNMYDRNIIYAKYRNLVAISTIYEYLESGRCDTLEGKDGAYNLYEMELRQNLVIGSLNEILLNLNQIQNNQFALYQQLNKSNRILAEISDSAKLDAYFSEMTALAASAERHIVGVIV